MSGVACRSLTASYNGHAVLDSVDLEVRPGEWVAVIGPNGAGKSTLLRCLAGTLEARGEVTLDGRPITGLARRDVARLVAVVPQSPIIPEGVTVFDYVLLGRTPHIGYWSSEGAGDIARAEEILARLDLAELADRHMSGLSGGERQLAVLGRALAQDAGVLLLDEPTTALDLGHQVQVLEQVDKLRRSESIAVVSAIHDLTLAGQYADRLIMLDKGRVVADGLAAEVLTTERLERHYGASVSVLHGEDGSLVVVPRRR